jgi:hypothetical protein
MATSRPAATPSTVSTARNATSGTGSDGAASWVIRRISGVKKPSAIP